MKNKVAAFEMSSLLRRIIIKEEGNISIFLAITPDSSTSLLHKLLQQAFTVKLKTEIRNRNVNIRQ
jgi:hypothetical protein